MKRLTATLLVIALILTAASLAACSSGDAPAEAVLDYLDALITKDADRIVTLSCADWESSAIIEVDSLEAVDARLEDAACTSNGTDGDFTLVDCTGSIVLTYDGEDRPLELDARTYLVIEEGGEWLMCGYQ